MILPDATTLWIFAAACLAVYLSPGPDTLYIAGRAAAAPAGKRVRAGLLSGFGVCIGVQIHLALTVLGLAALVTQWPILLVIIKWAGAAYLAYLGIKILFSRGSDNGDEKPLEPASDRRLIRDGMLVNLLNPKMPAFFLAFLPQFVDPAAGSASLQLLLFGGLFAIGGLFWTGFQSLVFGALTDVLTRVRPVKSAIKWISGTLLIGLAANLALQQR